MFCANCGKEFMPEAVFCIYCGTPVRETVLGEMVLGEPPLTPKYR